jgi:serine/threonine protein kinase
VASVPDVIVGFPSSRVHPPQILDNQFNMSDEINYPTGFSLKDIVSWGNSGMIYLDESSRTIVKAPHGAKNKDHIAIEQRIYQRLSEHGGHDGLLHYYGPYESGIRLDFASNGDLRSFLEACRTDIDIERQLRWSKKIAAVLHFVHSKRVVHGDLRCSNILLDNHFNAKLADFAGSSLDGSSLLVGVTTSHRSPGPALSVQGDIFALGSTLYEIITRASPYHEFSEEEIEARYSRCEFLETKSLGPIGDVILHCWQGQYSSCDAILTQIEGMNVVENVCFIAND